MPTRPIPTGFTLLTVALKCDRCPWEWDPPRNLPLETLVEVATTHRENCE